MKTLMRHGLALAVIVSGCGGTSDSSTTTGQTETTAEAGAATTTEAALPPTTTTSTPAPATTSTVANAPGDATERVEAKMAAVEATVPEGWTVTVAPSEEFEEDQDLLYDTCLQPGEFDIDQLDDISEATLTATVEGPAAANTFFPGPRASIEARVIENEAMAKEAFVVFERLYGSEEGLRCLTDVVVTAMGEDVPEDDITLETEQILVDGSQAGARFSMIFNVEGFEGGVHIEFQGARIGDCTVVATFITFGEPFDRDVAGALFSAAVNA